ncbi:unnamed protein product [Urochloa humidicola]
MYMLLVLGSWLTKILVVITGDLVFHFHAKKERKNQPSLVTYQGIHSGEM